MLFGLMASILTFSALVKVLNITRSGDQQLDRKSVIVGKRNWHTEH